MRDRTYTIYALTDPGDNGVRYIGITVNPDERLKQHIWGDMNIRKREWIRELNRSGLAPIMYTIETAKTEGEALEREAYWIQHPEKTRWLRELEKRGLQPCMEVIEGVNGSLGDVIERERYWIRYYTYQGFELLNR